MDAFGEETEAVRAATERLLATVDALSESLIPEPSLLPGWSRGHVLAHLAGNADGHRRMLDGAEQGVLAAQYASPEARQAEIEAGASKSSAEIVADLRAACEALDRRYRSLSLPAWDRPVRPLGRERRPARRLLWARLREVEVHHVDLAAGYGFADWSEAFAARLLGEVAGTFAARGDRPALRLVADDVDEVWGTGQEPEFIVSGPFRELCAWLIGRASGDGLRSDSDLPTPPRWA